MIGHIEGHIVYKEERTLIVSAGGVGYRVHVLPSLALGDDSVKVALWTHLAVREDALDLYGFSTRKELSLFQLLIGISGIGPKSALNVLSLADIGTLERAVRSGDSAYLTKVSGIGKKLAEKIVLELKEKIGTAADEEDTASKAETEALDALEALGYSPRETREVVRSLAREHKSAEEIIKKTLQTIGKH